MTGIFIVIPAQAGIHFATAPAVCPAWTPAFAGVTPQGNVEGAAHV
ncbi:hypothetical protein [Magnetospirillum sp. UT-4]|nr:hypothetical protein [Magnetospirillum sp. UT-4]